MSEKSKKTSKTSKKSTSSNKVSKEEISTTTNIEVRDEKMTENVDEKNVSKDETIEPTEKASKVFGDIAAYSWWKKIGIFNVLWTCGIIFLILALAWKGQNVDKNNANLIFASIMLAIGLLTIILIETFYYVKKIKSFNKQQELMVMILSFIPLGFIANFILGSLESKRFFAYEKVSKMGYVKPKFTMPHVYIVLLIIIFIVIVASWLVTWTNNGSVDNVVWKLSNGAELKATWDSTKWIISSNASGIDPLVTQLNSEINSVTRDDVSSLISKIEAYMGNLSSKNGTLTEEIKKLTLDGSATINYELAQAGFLYLLVAPIEGFKNAADLVIFLMIMGGFLSIVTESGALEAGLGRMVKKLQGKEIILIPILFLLFSIGGATYGMAEETIPFYMLLIPVFMAAGFDVYTAFITILFGAGLGTAASILNPFVVNSATSAVESATGQIISPSIGIAWRSVIYVALVILGASYTTWYGWRVKKHPEKSAVYDLRKEHEKQFSFNLDSLPEFTIKRKIILALFGLTFLSMIISVISWQDVAKTDAFVNATQWVDKVFPFLGGLTKDGNSLIGAWGTWYLIQMSFLFLLSSIIIGLLSWKGSKHFISKFMFGAADFIGVGFVIAISRGISIIVSKTGLDNIIINGLSSIMTSIGNAYGIIIVLFMIFFLLSFLIPSTSGFASAVFPLIGPAIGASSIPGLTISGAIGTFSLASGIVNVSMPSGGIFMSALSLSNVSIGRFYKNSWHFLLAFFGVALVMLIIGVAVNGSTSGIGGIF